MSSSSGSANCMKNVFGTALKKPYDKRSKPTCARVEDFHKFLNWSWLPVLTPWGVSTVFGRPGIHIKVAIYYFFGFAVFFYTVSIEIDQRGVDTFTSASMSLSGRLLTFMLSSYVGILVTNYWINVRRKTRNMNYGLSNAVDILSTTIDYDHPNAKQLLESIYGPLVVIGQYGIAIASKTSKFKKSNEEILDLFERNSLDGNYLLNNFPPKQIMHTLRLAILQEIQEERYNSDQDHDNIGCCLRRMTHFDFDKLREKLNEYSGWASSTSSCVSSSKLPYGYVQLVTWSTHAITLMSVYQLFQEKGANWSQYGICWPKVLYLTCHHGTIGPDNVANFQFFVFSVFQLFILYFVFGCLELYYVLEQSFSNGLVVQNYYGIIELICSPLNPSKNDSCHDDDQSSRKVKTNSLGPIKLSRLKLNKDRRKTRNDSTEKTQLTQPEQSSINSSGFYSDTHTSI